MSPRRSRFLGGQHADDPAAALREHLIAATDHLIRAHGLVGLTTRAIARHAGVADGVLYNHFRDKEGLLVATIVQRFDTLGTAFEQHRLEPGVGDLETNLVQLCEATLDFHAGLVPLITGLVGDRDLFRRVMREIHGRHFGPQHTQERVAAYLAAEQRIGRAAPSSDPAAAAALLTGACHALAMAAEVMPDVTIEQQKRQLPALVRTVVRGVGGSGG